MDRITLTITSLSIFSGILNIEITLLFLNAEMQTKAIVSASLFVALFSSVQAQGVLRITEFMSEGQGLIGPGTGANRQREFFELTNVGSAALDISSYSYNDNNVNDPHNFGASFGVVASGESIILTQMTADNFRSYWGLSSSVRIFSYGQASNLGNNDTINIYNSATQSPATLVDSLLFTETARGSGISRNRPVNIGTGQAINDLWVDSVVGDSYGSILAPNPIFPVGAAYVDLANPGTYPVPEPATLFVLSLGIAKLVRARKSA